MSPRREVAARHAAAAPLARRPALPPSSPCRPPLLHLPAGPAMAVDDGLANGPHVANGGHAANGAAAHVVAADSSPPPATLDLAVEAPADGMQAGELLQELRLQADEFRATGTAHRPGWVLGPGCCQLPACLMLLPAEAAVFPHRLPCKPCWNPLSDRLITRTRTACCCAPTRCRLPLCHPPVPVRAATPRRRAAPAPCSTPSPASSGGTTAPRAWPASSTSSPSPCSGAR